MSEKVKIDIVKRDDSINPRQLRATGNVPATVYGYGVEAESIQLAVKSIKMLSRAQRNSILELNDGSNSFDVIIKNIQKDFTTDEVLNIEFQRVFADRKVKVKVSVSLEGEAPAAKAGGPLRQTRDEIEVLCLPKDAPDNIVVNISPLENFEDTIVVNELEYPEGVEPVTNGGVILVKVGTPRGAAA